jgi:hypothetical protein
MANTSLITLQTDLKSLRYGSDKPYITKDVNDPPSSNQTGMQITKRVDDLSRIAQMLIDRPGLKFIGNQALLQQVDVQGKLQKARDKKTTLGGKVFEQVKGTVLNTAKILGSTIAQVPVNGTGTHFVYAFRTDTYLQPSGGNNRTAFAQFFGAGGVEGAPYALKGQEVPGKVETQFIGVRGDVISPEGGDAKFTYNTPVKQDGDGGTNWNEKSNKQILETIPRESSREYSKRGLPISVTTAAPAPATGRNADTGETVTVPGLFVPNPLNPRDTTVISESFGRSNKDVEGDVTPLEQPKIAPFKEDENTRKSKLDTVSNIRNTLTGSAVPLKDSSRETTATPGSSLVTGIVNTGYTDENTSNPADELGLIVPTTSRDTKEDSYGKNSTDYLNNLAGYEPTKSQFWEEGEGIPPTSVSTHLVNQNTARSVNKEVKSSEEKFDTNSVGNKYYEQQKRRTINGTEKNVIKDTRVNLGDQGRKKAAAYYTDYSNTDELSEDKLNALDIQNSRPDGVDAARDLAKFFFEIITPEGSKFLNFRAFITTMDDSYNANWEAKKYVGRADDFYTYGGFSRDISVGFKIAAATRSEMKPLYRKMVYLASTTAPTYGDYKFMRGTVVRLSLGSYFNEIPGVITSVKYTWSTDYPWEIAVESPEGGESGVQELPMVMDCSISFKPIHDFVPQTGLQHYITSKESNKTFF